MWYKSDWFILIHLRPGSQIKCIDPHYLGSYANPIAFVCKLAGKTSTFEPGADKEGQAKNEVCASPRKIWTYAKGSARLCLTRRAHIHIKIHGQTHISCKCLRLSQIVGCVFVCASAMVCETVSTPVLFPFPLLSLERARSCISFSTTSDSRTHQLQSQLVAGAHHCAFDWCENEAGRRLRILGLSAPRARRENLVLLMSVTHNKIIII